jgi:hypothetical protein
MGGWMDVLMVGWTVVRMDWWMVDAMVDRWIGDGLVNRWMVGWMNG